MVDSGVSVWGVWGDDETENGGAPACTGTGAGAGFGGDVDGGCWVLLAKAARCGRAVVRQRVTWRARCRGRVALKIAVMFESTSAAGMGG